MVTFREAWAQYLSSHSLILLQLGSEACAPCRAIWNKIESWQKDHSQVSIHYASIDRCPEFWAQMEIFAVPTVVLYAEGKQVLSASGYFSLEEILRKAEQLELMLMK